jgi:TRAP-type C4-dicarboxylate transport system permease large subunit
MFVIIIGLCFLFIFTYFTYEAAKQNGYNSFFWAAAAVGTFIGVYVFLFLICGSVIVIGRTNWGWTTDTPAGGVGELIHLVILALSLGSTTPILWYVSRKPDELTSMDLPPPPPDFNQ